MGYTYGTKGIPSVSPGLPRRTLAALVADPTSFPAKVMLVRSNQVIQVPAWATYARMGATGAGGNGSLDNGTTGIGNGGGGGGFAGSNQIKVTPGAAITVSFTGSATVIEGLGYRLVGGNGGNSTANNGGQGVGGTASGGDVNYTGGNGGAGTSANTAGSGGGAASRGGNGVNGVNSNGGPQGGSNGGPGSGYLSGGGGGAASNCNGSIGPSNGACPPPPAWPTTSVGTLGQTGLMVGTASGFANSANTSTYQGGDGGGGGGSWTQSSISLTPGPCNGGAGIAVIEFW